MPPVIEVPPPPSYVVKQYVVAALKIAVSVALLAVLFSRIDVGRLWATARRASPLWLCAAMALYFINVVASTWRWHVLLEAQHLRVPFQRLFGSYLVATYWNNFLPSNIGGDVVRIADTAKAAGSKTLATTVVLMDRGLGLMALVLVAALGATAAGLVHPAAEPIGPIWLWAGLLVGAAASAPAVFAPTGLGRLLQPLTVFHPEWVGGRIAKLTSVLGRFGESPRALGRCFSGAVFVQGTMVVFYFAVAYALHLNVGLFDLAVIVPISFVVQMLPVSVNGFGVREATFSFYFTRIGQPIEAALLVSLVAQALLMLFSLSGAAVSVSRHRQRLKSAL